MDFGRVIGEAWRITRKAAALRVLGLFSAIQLALYMVIVGLVVVPMSILTQLLVTTSSPARSESAIAQREALATGALTVSSWLSSHGVLVFGGLGMLLAAWAVFGVLDVAATGGVIAQTDVVTRGGRASVPTGLREGFRVWWRTAGLVAISALPSLLFMFAGAVLTLFAITLPLAAGRAPDGGLLRLGNLLTAPLSTLVTLLNIPLTILVALGLRFAILDGLHWRAALVRAWDLARSNLADVALLYLIIMGILIAASLACAAATLVVVFAGALAGGLAYATGATATSAPMISIAVITGLVLLAGYLLFVVIVVVWQSVTWTVFWRRLTAPAPVPVTDGASGLPHEEGAAV